MPSDYSCRSCKLVFSVGWYHFHEYENHPSATRIVCGNCGTVHEISHGRTTRISPETDINNVSKKTKYELKKVPDTLSALSGPLIASREIEAYEAFEEMLAESDLEWHDYGKLENIRPHREVPSCDITEGCAEELCLDNIACACCAKTGMFIVETAKELKECPRCGSDTLELFVFWMT